MEVLLGFLEPAPGSDALLALRDLRGLFWRLVTREGGNHDRDREHPEKSDHCEKRQSRKQQTRRLGLCAAALLSAAPKRALARHCAEIILDARPLACRRLRHPLPFHDFQVSAFAVVLNNLAPPIGVYFVRGTARVATVLSPHFTVTVVTL